MSQKTSNDYGLIPDILRESNDRRCRDFILRPNMNGGISYCALGAIYHKMGLTDKEILFRNMPKRLQAFKKLGIVNHKSTWKVCPICHKPRYLLQLVAHLNDDHNLRWGEIADNLERAIPYDRIKYGWIQHIRNFLFGIK